MRTFRVLAIFLLVAGGLAVLLPDASASVPTLSKTCKSLNSLDKSLRTALAAGDAGNVNTSAVSALSKSLRKAEKSGPKSLRSAMKTMGDVAANVAHTSSPAAAALALKKGGQKLAAALVTWGTYIANHCTGSNPATT